MLLETDEEYVALKRFGHSVSGVLARYPEGAPDRIVSGALLIPESELKFVYDSIVKKIQILMQVEVD